jgi:hypothetical protein
MSELVEVGGVIYDILPGTEIAAWVREMASREWEPEDFEKWGQDLLAPVWVVQVVPVSEIRMRPELLASQEFWADLENRIATQIGLIQAGTPVPPLVLRGGDLFLLDGYARAHALQALGVPDCLAYVSKS